MVSPKRGPETEKLLEVYRKSTLNVGKASFCLFLDEASWDQALLEQC
jgi:hypothetical protein